MNVGCFPDSLGSGDDEDDNDLEDASAETDIDQVYFSRGTREETMTLHLY
jgi:hypothetical protein